MNKKRYEEIAEAVAQFNYYEDFLKQAKEEIRNLSKEEVEKINKETNLHISRSPKTFITYSEEYKTEVEKLKVKFPPEKEVKENYTITLTTSNKPIRKAEEIRELAQNNITAIKKMAASINKNKAK